MSGISAELNDSMGPIGSAGQVLFFPRWWTEPAAISLAAGNCRGCGRERLGTGERIGWPNVFARFLMIRFIWSSS
jgi:hypothetical protein